LYADMASPHNGYLSVLLGSGAIGLVLVLLMNVRLLGWYRVVRRRLPGYEWMLPAYAFLAVLTFLDYGIWGVTSPALLVFFVVYFALWRLRRIARARAANQMTGWSVVADGTQAIESRAFPP
jgi:hypothetical protein